MHDAHRGLLADALGAAGDVDPRIAAGPADDHREHRRLGDARPVRRQAMASSRRIQEDVNVTSSLARAIDHAAQHARDVRVDGEQRQHDDQRQHLGRRAAPAPRRDGARASISSVTFIVPISRRVRRPGTAATMIAVSSGDSSRSIASRPGRRRRCWRRSAQLVAPLVGDHHAHQERQESRDRQRVDAALCMLWRITRHRRRPRVRDGVQQGDGGFADEGQILRRAGESGQGQARPIARGCPAPAAAGASVASSREAISCSRDPGSGRKPRTPTVHPRCSVTDGPVEAATRHGSSRPPVPTRRRDLARLPGQRLEAPVELRDAVDSPRALAARFDACRVCPLRQQ